MLRRCLAELVGTFVIVFAPVAFAAHGESGLIGSAIVSGLAVMAMVYTFGPISGAHFNPAVTLAFAATKHVKWREVLPYWAMQLCGATLAALFALALFHHPSGSHIPRNPEMISTNVGLEAALGFLLMLVIMSVATDPRVSPDVPALAIGMTVVCGVLVGGPITGGSMNPARSFGPALLDRAAFGQYWLYIVGPCIGALLASKTYGWLTRNELNGSK